MVQLWPWLFLAGLGALHGLSPANGWLFAAACGVRARNAAAVRRALLPVALGHGASVALVVIAVLQGVLVGGDGLRRIAGGGLVLVAVGRCLYDAVDRWNAGVVRHWLCGAAYRRRLRSAAVAQADVVGSATHTNSLHASVFSGHCSPARSHAFATSTGAMESDSFATHAGIALWSCLMATVHGAGLMLVPALVPLCLSDSPARAITASGSPLLALAAVGVHLAAMLLTTGLIAAGICRGIARLPALPASVLRQAWTAALGATGGWLLVSR